ncbi:MAG TPA: tetratricopeptide repeat protein [Mucilaginibacter sp.]|nr:tetratricopeptide repeat protein [Mucilaginibacter sp.]
MASSLQYNLRNMGIKKEAVLGFCFLFLAVAGYAQTNSVKKKKLTHPAAAKQAPPPPPAIVQPVVTPPPVVVQPAPQQTPADDKTLIKDTIQKEKISYKDAKEIIYEAGSLMGILQTTLNIATSSDSTPADLASVVNDSYKPGATYRIFEARDVIIEDDIDPQFALGKSRDVSAEKYLTQLDVNYEKSLDNTIAFSNIGTSDVKKKEYIYVKVRFDSNFGSKYKSTGGTYTMRKREAEIKMVKIGPKKWQGLIKSIRFYDPTRPIEDKDNNMQVASDTSSSGTLMSDEDFENKKRLFLAQREEEEKKNQAIFDEFVNDGNSYMNNKQYKEALDSYAQAKALKPLVPSLDKKINLAKKQNADNTYENYKGRGDKAKNERKFNDAVLFYNQAIALKPDASSILQPEINLLNKKIDIITRPNNKVQSGDYDAAIEECERELKEHKKEKNDYPELYFIQAIAYQKLAERNAGGKSDLEKALINFNTAIQYNTNYKDARLARAYFFVKYKNDIPGAISDYDVLAGNELDDSPDKPLYFVAKAKLKDIIHNTTDALADYNRALVLSKDNDATIYFDKGELQYRLETYNDAQKSFNSAIKINPKYTAAFYYRGLNFVGLNKTELAGNDFAQAEQLGLEPNRLKTVDSISNIYFLKGKELADKHDFANADSAYANALRIRKCNANAIHGQAEIQLITGDELSAKKQLAAAKAKYNESIILNRNALECSPNFSDVHFKEGLAHSKIKEYNVAIACYTKAISSDNNNVQAYTERGNAYQVQEKYSNAVEDYGQAIILLQVNIESAKKGSDKLLVKSLTTNLSKSNLLKGQAYYYLADYRNAMASLNSAVDLLETNNEALYYRGLVYFAQGDLPSSGKDLDAAIKMKPDYRYYYANGKTNYRKKNYPYAISNFSESITADSLNTLNNKLYLRGLSYFKSKQYNEAVNDFSLYSKSENSKSDTAFFADYGEAQLFKGLDTAAVSNFNYTLKMNPNNAKALYDMGCYYAKNNQFDKAIDYFQRAFLTHGLTKDEIKLQEDIFLADFNKVKANKSKYNDLRKANLKTD